MIITVSGTVGSGKSTLSKAIAEKLGYERIYVGGVRRDLAKHRGMTLEEFNLWSETHPEGDVLVDDMIKKQMIGKDNVVLEGRVMHHFFPQAKKLYIYCDPKIAAERIFGDINAGNRSEEGVQSKEEIQQGITTREASDALRYEQYYNLKVNDLTTYDFVLDTSHLTPAEALEKTLTFIGNSSTIVAH